MGAAKLSEVVILILILAPLTSLLSLFIQKCMESGMILRRYYLYLTYCWIRWRLKENRWKRSLLKPIGLCIYCYSSWVWLNVYSMLFDEVIQNGELGIFLLGAFLGLGVNYITIEKMNK